MSVPTLLSVAMVPMSKQSQRRRAQLSKVRHGNLFNTGQTPRGRLEISWKYVNSPLIIMIMSTLVIGGIGRFLLHEQAREKEIRADHVRERQLIVEYYNRTQILSRYMTYLIHIFKDDTVENDTKSIKNGEDYETTIDHAIDNFTSLCLNPIDTYEVRSRIAGGISTLPSPAVINVAGEKKIYDDNKKTLAALRPIAFSAIYGSPPYHTTRPEFKNISLSSIIDSIEELDTVKISSLHLILNDGKILKRKAIINEDIGTYTPAFVAYTGLESDKYPIPEDCDTISRIRQLLLYGFYRTGADDFFYDAGNLKPPASEAPRRRDRTIDSLIYVGKRPGDILENSLNRQVCTYPDLGLFIDPQSHQSGLDAARMPTTPAR